MSARHSLAAARRERGRVEERLAEKIVELEKLERRRSRRRALRLPVDEAHAERLAEELGRLRGEIRRANKAVRELESEFARLGRRARRLRRRIRAAVRPKVHKPFLPAPSRPMSAMGPIVGSIGHYTAGALAEDDDQAVRLWKLVDQQHRAQGWSMTGYHVGLGPDGGIYPLRPINSAGAHTLGRNTGYVGFSVHGTTGDRWTKAQLRAFRRALKHYRLDGKPVWGHNDFNATACPGSFKRGYTSKGRSA